MALTASKAFCSGSSAKLAKKSSRASTVRMPVVVRAQAGEQAAEVVRNRAWGPIGAGGNFQTGTGHVCPRLLALVVPARSIRSVCAIRSRASPAGAGGSRDTCAQ